MFHPRSADAAEDDGVLMGYVYDAATDRSELAIIDAQTLEDVATVKLPHHWFRPGSTATGCRATRQSGPPAQATFSG